MNSKHLILLSLSLLLLLSAFSCGKKTTEPGLERVSTPFFDPPGGTYTSSQTVSISCATSEVTIFYTIDGTEPNSGSSVYKDPIPILFDDTSTSIKAKAFRSGFKDSKTAQATYNLTGTVATPTFNLEEGTYFPAREVTLTCSTPRANIHYTTDGSEPTLSSTIYSSPINVSNTTTIKAKGFMSGWTPSSTASATYAIELLPIEMIFVPGGTFTMGNTIGGEEYWDMDESKIHSVTLNSFYIGKYEVSQAEYANLMQPESWEQNYGLGDDYPAYNISWYAAIKYCNLRSMAEGFTPAYSISGSTNPADWGSIPDYNNSAWNAAICNWDADGYRLPTEAEWEYAAKGTTDTPVYQYSGSNDADAVAWHLGNSSFSSHPVGTKDPNGIGTYDMTGNISEWCWDWYEEYQYSPQDNPKGPTSGVEKMLRGGNWGFYNFQCRVPARSRCIPEPKILVSGLRVVRAIQ